MIVLAASVVVPVGGCHEQVREGLAERARKVRVGDGAHDGVTMGPLISAKHKEKVVGYIERGVQEGAEIVVDGREGAPEGDEGGNRSGSGLAASSQYEHLPQSAAGSSRAACSMGCARAQRICIAQMKVDPVELSTVPCLEVWYHACA